MLTTVVLGFAVGLMLPLLLPSLLASTQYGPRVGQAYCEFVAKALKRPGIGVGKHGDLSVRQLSFDDLYDQETIESGGVERKITRTAKNVHRLGKTPFVLFDEVFGVTFDLRDVLIGGLEHRHRDDGEMVYTYKEFDEATRNPTRVDHYVRAFFEITERPALDLDLDESVRPIVDGSEKSHWWEHMWESVRRMYIHRQEDVSFLKMMLPWIITGGALFLGYYLLGPGKMPGSPMGSSDPLTVGSVLLLALPTLSDRQRQAFQLMVVTLAVGGLIALGVIVAGVVSTVVFIGALIGGAATLPVLTILAGGIGRGENLGDLFMWAGLQGFREPVLDLTADDRYCFVEADELGLENPPKVKLAKTLVALSCDVSPEAFGHAGYTSKDLVDYLPNEALVADGGNSVLPRGYVATDGIVNGGHQGFMPTEPDDSATYVRADNWLARFKDAATGDALDTAENEATKEFAAGDPEYGTSRLMKWSAAGAIGGFGFWVVVALVF